MKICAACPLKAQCVRLTKKDRPQGARIVIYPTCHKIIEKDKAHNKTPEFEEAINKRYRVERRFATMVKNHMLRRSRFTKLCGATKHNLLANTACNLVRLVNIHANPDCCAKLGVNMG